MNPATHYIAYTACPLGSVIMTSTQTALTGLFLEGQSGFLRAAKMELEEKELDVFLLAKRWLDLYFQGQKPAFSVPLLLQDSPFRLVVWELLQQIPYGRVSTYGTLARAVAARQGMERMSAQAVGGAVGSNPISIIIPCHRVVGSRFDLRGYNGGIEKKEKLLLLEQADLHHVFECR